MYCRHCGDDIDASRLLTDTAFCCDAHRQEHRERRGTVPGKMKSGATHVERAAATLESPKLQDTSARKPRFKFRYVEKTARISALETALPPSMKPLAAAPPPPAHAMLLGAAATERCVAPVVSGRLALQNLEPELPAFSLSLRRIGPARSSADETWKPIPTAAPVERVAAARAVSECVVASQADLELPTFALDLIAPAPVRRPADEVAQRIPVAAPVERVLAPQSAPLIAFAASTAVQPTLGCLALADPAYAIAPDVRRVIPKPQKGAEPALSAAGPVSSVTIMVPAAHQPEYCGYFPNGPEREVPALPLAVSARSLATPVSGRVPASPPMRLPRFGGTPMQNRGLTSAPFVKAVARAAEETAMPRQIEQVPVSTVTVRLPQSPEPVKYAALALSELMPLEYFCSRGPRVHPHGVGWIVPSLSATAPRFTAPLIIERFEPLPAEKKKPGKRPGFAEIFTLPEAASMRSHKVREWSKIIAACLVMGAMLWYGTSFLRSDHDSGAGQSLLADDSTALHANPAVRGSGGAFHRMRSSIAERAEVHLNDTFHGGMAAWGASAASLAPGWVHHPEGYVTPGKFALYRPTLHYTDYRFEFFGQIDSKSLDWAVRASDDANYYAMKFASDGPGPRAVVSMIHYPVVAGQKGPRVVTPLNIMIHEHTPYHVEVDVQGDRVTTSIEGEQVDSFVDGTLARGGVGFFADAGEQARLYWIKVSRNEDWLGRVCAFLSGGNSNTAQVWPPAGNMPRPDSGAPMPSNHLVLAAGFGLLRRNALGRISYHRRFSSWRI